MSEHSFDENYANLVCQQIGAIAQAMLADEISFLSGARRISLLRRAIASGEDDHDLMILAKIEAETAHLPLEGLSQYSEKQALDFQGEIEASEVWARIFGKPACESIVGRFRN